MEGESMSDDDVISLDYSSLTDFLAELEKSPAEVLPFATQAMENSVAAIHDGVATYPDATAANAPGRVDRNGKPMGYYERGKGWWRPLLRATTVLAHGTMAGGKYGKSIGRGIYPTGGKVPQVAGYKLNPSSEKLGQSWTTDVQSFEEGGVVGEVGTNTSYADPVQGAGQSDVMEAIGWQAVHDTVEGLTETIVGYFSDAFDDYLEYIASK
jgi:hypothetical protein